MPAVHSRSSVAGHVAYPASSDLRPVLPSWRRFLPGRNLRLRVVKLLLALGNLLGTLFNLRGGGAQLLFTLLNLGRGGINLGVRLVELGFRLRKLGGGGERVGDRIHGRNLAGELV